MTNVTLAIPIAPTTSDTIAEQQEEAVDVAGDAVARGLWQCRRRGGEVLGRARRQGDRGLDGDQLPRSDLDLDDHPLRTVDAEVVGARCAGDDHRAEKAAIAEGLVDDADHREVVLPDVQPRLHLEPGDAQLGCQVGADDRDRVAATHVASVEPSTEGDVTAHGVEQSCRGGQHRSHVLVLTGDVEHRDGADRPGVHDVGDRTRCDDPVQPVEPLFDRPRQRACRCRRVRCCAR